MQQTDVKSKNITTASGVAASVGPVRVKSLYAVITAAATGSISFKDGSSTGLELIKLDTPNITAGQNTTISLLLPGEGVRFSGDPYVTLSNVTSLTFFYG
jgi:hypothetical protein